MGYTFALEFHLHIGYTAEGNKVIRELDSTEIGKLLFHSDNPDAWRTIVDVKNNRMVRLTDDDLKVYVHSAYVYAF